MSPTSELVAAPRLTRYRAADARGIRFTPEALASYDRNNLERIWQQYETVGPAWTMWVGEEVVGCAGLMLLWPGRAHAWLLPSVLLAQYPKTVVKSIVQQLRQAITELQLVRIQCDVQADFRIGRRLVEWLGFEQEGPVMLRYGPHDEDFCRYVIIQPRTP